MDLASAWRAKAMFVALVVAPLLHLLVSHVEVHSNHDDFFVRPLCAQTELLGKVLSLKSIFSLAGVWDDTVCVFLVLPVL